MSKEFEIFVSLISKEAGGRSVPINWRGYGCPVLISGDYYDCRFIEADAELLAPGSEHRVKVKFLNEGAIEQFAKRKAHIELWEGRTIATGRFL